VNDSELARADWFFQRRNFGFGNFEQVQIATRDLENQQIAKMV